MDQQVIQEVLESINQAGGLVLDLDWWWPGYATDPVVASESVTVAGTVMLIQTTQSGLVLLNGEVVEPAAKVVR